MSEQTKVSTTTVNNLGVAMFTVADVDAAIAFYTEKLGWELRADVSFGENGDHRWVEVAPPGSTARLALNPQMGPDATPPGTGAIGVETADVRAEYERLKGLGVAVPEGPPQEIPGAPLLFMTEDPDGNAIAVVQV